MPRFFPNPAFKRWREARDKAIELWDELPENPAEFSEDIKKKFESNDPKVDVWSIPLTDYTVNTKSEDEMDSLYYNLICEFKKEHGGNNESGFCNYVIFNKNAGALYVSERILDEKTYKNVYFLSSEIEDKKTSILTAKVYSCKGAPINFGMKWVAFKRIFLTISFLLAISFLIFIVNGFGVVGAIGSVLLAGMIMGLGSVCLDREERSLDAWEDSMLIPEEAQNEQWFRSDYATFRACLDRALDANDALHTRSEFNSETVIASGSSPEDRSPP